MRLGVERDQSRARLSWPVLLAAAGNLTQTYRTDEFGITDPAGTAGTRVQPMQYTSEQRDSTGLMQLRARMYTPEPRSAHQRLGEIDPVGASGAAIMGAYRPSR